MDDWRALDHAMLLTVAYRGSPRLEKALELLKINDYEELRSEKTPLIPGALTWAKVAGVAVEAAAKGLLQGDAERAAEYAESVRTLAERLRERDGHVNARVTAQTRSQIGMLVATAACVEAALSLRDGKVAADDYDALGKLVSLRMRWHALRRERGSHADGAWVVDLVQKAAGRVLSSDAGAGAKAMAARAVAALVPTEAATSPVTVATPVATPPSSPGAEAMIEAPAAKRFKVSGDGPGVKVEWTDDDDLLF